VPQLADAEEVLSGIKKKDGVIYEALVPNVKGVERAIQAGVTHIDLIVSASESHNQRNVRMSIAESMKALREVVKLALHNDMIVTGGIPCAFGCSIEGWVSPKVVNEMADQYLDMGVQEISLGDTVGLADPAQVYEMVSQHIGKLKGTDRGLRLHFHDTRGAGLSNVLAAMLAGATIFDTSLCGLGGCPFAPGATGNIATGDTVNMLEAMGIDTGVDLEKIVDLEKMVQELLGKKLPGEVLKAGPTPWALDKSLKATGTVPGR
jgi:hydroxymethylglutaryl-CoA lyase